MADITYTWVEEEQVWIDSNGFVVEGYQDPEGLIGPIYGVTLETNNGTINNENNNDEQTR